MRPASSPHLRSISGERHFHHQGLYFDEFATDSAWIRERAELRVPSCEGVRALVLRGEIRTHPAARGSELGAPGLMCQVEGRNAAALPPGHTGSFELRIELSAESAARGPVIGLALTGTGLTNALAWLGRVTGYAGWQRFRAQNKNRQLRIKTLTTDDGEMVFDFSLRLSPRSAAFARRHARLGINVVGFLTADLGIGESARCMVRAADAAGIPTALVPLKLHCKNRLGDQTYAARLQPENPHAVNVVHLDPPASPDLDHHHGRKFRAGKYNVAYWAWELPEFPDAWLPHFAFFDEVWCPSEFVRAAIAAKSPLPVVTMPHAIAFERPTGGTRSEFGLPPGKFLFLCLYDLNSYSERKNPRGAIEAFQRSGLRGNAGLVIKVQNLAGNERDFAALQSAVRHQPDITLITGTLSREAVYRLEAACDSLVSLHRSEGFGLAIAESMYLGKPVISTHWSASAEYVTKSTGCPVNCSLTTLTESHGPYSKGQTWAEPDLDHAAQWMRNLATDRQLAAALGSAARIHVEQNFSPAVIGARYRQRLESIAAF